MGIGEQMERKEKIENGEREERDEMKTERKWKKRK